MVNEISVLFTFPLHLVFYSENSEREREREERERERERERGTVSSARKATASCARDVRVA